MHIVKEFAVLVHSLKFVFLLSVTVYYHDQFFFITTIAYMLLYNKKTPCLLLDFIIFY